MRKLITLLVAILIGQTVFAADLSNVTKGTHRLVHLQRQVEADTNAVPLVTIWDDGSVFFVWEQEKTKKMMPTLLPCDRVRISFDAGTNQPFCRFDIKNSFRVYWIDTVVYVSLYISPDQIIFRKKVE